MWEWGVGCGNMRNGKRILECQCRCAMCRCRWWLPVARALAALLVRAAQQGQWARGPRPPSRRATTLYPLPLASRSRCRCPGAWCLPVPSFARSAVLVPGPVPLSQIPNPPRPVRCEARSGRSESKSKSKRRGLPAIVMQNKNHTDTAQGECPVCLVCWCAVCRVSVSISRMDLGLGLDYLGPLRCHTDIALALPE